MDVPPLPTDPQAAATIEAAVITAQATTRAAWIQSGAAVGAIAGGALAYFGAVRQVRLQERAQEVRAIAYRFRLTKIVDEYHNQIARAWMAATKELELFRRSGSSIRITSFRVAQPQSLHDENWEVHALLGRRAVELILIIDEANQRLARFDKEIGQADVKTDSHFEYGSLKAVEENADGSTTYRPEDAIVDYVDVLDRLRRALAELRNELEKAPRLSSWDRLHRLVARSRRPRHRAAARGMARGAEGK
jgi:hypothetical protein